MQVPELGSPRVHLRRTDSTNERVRQLAIAGAPHGLLVTAGEQTAGRGRHGRSWLAPPGSCLLCSLLLRPPAAGERLGLLPLIAGVAVCEAIGPRARVKWPNDVVFERPRPGAHATAAGPAVALAKVAGILVEARPQEGWAVLGIGVNVALRVQDLPAEVRSRAASLERPASAVETLLARLLQSLSARLDEPPRQALERWRELDALHGREVVWAQGRGHAGGVDEEGRLLVRLPGGDAVALSAGDVHLHGVV